MKNDVVITKCCVCQSLMISDNNNCECKVCDGSEIEVI